MQSKTFSIINIAGLDVGIACFITLFLFIVDELGYDRFNKQADNVYRVYVHLNINGKKNNNSKSAAPTGALLVKDFPEVLAYTRIGYFGTHTLRHKEKISREGRIYTADSAFFSVLSYPLLYGDPARTLAGPNNMVLTQTSAERYFGKENPVGKTFIIHEKGS